MPEFSVIIPVYNVEKYLARCIESITSQIYTDFELILINDGSSDDSGNICNKYAKKDSRIRVIHQKNKGVSAARNIGIKSANGKYIVFVDSDDVVEKDYLSSMAEVDSEVDLVICGIKQVIPGNEPYARKQYEKKQVLDITKRAVLEMILNDANSSSVSKRFKKCIIEERNIYFDERLDLGEDGCFVTEYVGNCKGMQYLDVSAYRYFKYEHKTLSTIDELCIRRVTKSNKKMEAILKGISPNIVENQIWKRKKYQLYPKCIFDILRNKEYCLVKKYKLLKSIFEIDEFQDFVKNIDVCMAEDTELIRRIISTRNVHIVVLVWELLVLKGELIKYKRKIDDKLWN